MPWIDPASINTLPGDPVTSEFGYMAKDNPVGLAAGDAGAPRIQAQAMNTFLGSFGQLRSAGADLSIRFTDLPPYLEGVVVIANYTQSANADLRVALSDDNGVSYSAFTPIGQPTASGGTTIHVDLLTGVVHRDGNEYVAAVPTGAINAFLFDVFAQSNQSTYMGGILLPGGPSGSITIAD